MPWPSIVAESLRDVASGATTPAVTRGLLRCGADNAAPRDVPPTSPILHVAQQESWRRVTAALRDWNGALLAEPVGRGKTWIALATCVARPGAAHVIAPAILHPHWLRTAAMAHVDITVSTHEQLSRGRVPPGDPRLVVIDEAHRFRDPAAHRTRTVAPWLVGRAVLLVTATPIVNRLADLIALLRLVLPDDALALDGIPCLGALETCTRPPLALRRMVIRTAAPDVTLVPRRGRILDAGEAEERRGIDARTMIRKLTLSRSEAIRRLVTSVFSAAAASSDVALRAALRRYRALLRHARESGGASRAMVRHFAGASLDQLTLWSLVRDDDVSAIDLPLDDEERIEALLAAFRADDRWTDAIARCCIDGVPVICFTRHRETARLLVERLGDDTAWVTGDGAGIGPHRLLRDQVLSAFGRGRADWGVLRRVPRVLIATDVAAEGLDLQGAGRMVHVDLPWTAVRAEQREGRLLRLGQMHPEVDVVVRIPPRALEEELALTERIRRKRMLAERWLMSLEGRATASSPAPSTRCHALVLAQSGVRRGVLHVVADDGGWRVAPLDDDATFGAVARAATRLSPAVTNAVLRAASACIASGVPTAPTGLVVRIHTLAREAARRRDASLLRRLDRLLRFVTASPTAGAAARISELAAMSDAALVRAAVPDAAPAPFPVLTILVPSDPAFDDAATQLRCTHDAH